MDGLSTILAQLAPGANVETVLYMVPQGGKAVIQELVICNRDGTQATFRVSISPMVAPTQTKDYLYYALPLLGNDTFAAEFGPSGLTLNAFDTIRVFASTANLTFTLMGAKT